MTASALLTHPDCVRHEMGAHHPESPERLKAILRAIESAGLAPLLQVHEAPEATREQLLRVHAPEHVDLIFDSAPQASYAYLDPDTSMNPHSLSAALRAAGAVVRAVDLVMEGKARNAFCAVRPPGHHATPDRPMGFCIFNNVAVGAMHALEAHGLERVAVLDFDVHHGNGTEDAFHEDPRVMMCSTFQHPYYPYCGSDSSNEHIINVPLAAMTGGEGFREAVEKFWLPALDRFSPQMVFVSAGFDAHREDPLAYLEFEDEDYRWVTEKLVEVADAHANGRVVSTLEGGYNTVALGRCVVEHLEVLTA
ncbi:histone deacetylase family protein [Usitatibacter palustris]|uniref:Histone deacetylase-like amidohydrolase n=1 Tax=Usitatibacter palustris TaxID=2732487 RepID=A0A6M4H992_9PROT|nr:histone deacetylase family protein [Usitatibacter palustris]QJR15398.1 Histone deacetylase-like amidohydrolase [Usitatibacter palustris]